MLEIGSVVDGKYKVLSKIGQGGMSVVYLALNERANKTWAIKEVRKDGVQDFTAVYQSLIAETNILKGLSHKYLPSIVDVIDDKDTFLIVMDYIQGKSLNVVLRESMDQEGRPLFIEDVISWGIQLCEVLHYLHTQPQPIIYRDMKPANIMLKPDGEICVIDFGTARVFKTGNTEDTTCLGTQGYAAPEQYGGNGQTRPQTDIYNLGATLHHLITGINPAETSTPFKFQKITEARPTLYDETPRDLRERLRGLEVIIDKCVQYNIEDRYQNCMELKYDLEHPEDLGAPYRRRLKRRMGSFVACLAVAVILGGISLGSMWMENKTQQSGYDYYIDQASKVSTDEEAYEYYRSAIAIDPTNEEPYLLMLENMLSDYDFTSEESEIVLKALWSNDYSTTRANEDYLQSNAEGYIRVAYELGQAFYYYAGNEDSTTGTRTGDKSSAQSWLKIVAEADMDSLDFGDEDEDKTAWQARATVLYTICTYYNNLGQTDKTGDSSITYGDYWNDLMALYETEEASSDNSTTELRLYQEILYQIYINATNFRNDGVEQEEMQQILDEISVKLENFTDETSTTVKELVETVETYIEDYAQLAVDTAFGSTANAVSATDTDEAEGGED